MIRLAAILLAGIATPAFAATTGLHCEHLFDSRSGRPETGAAGTAATPAIPATP